MLRSFTNATRGTALTLAITASLGLCTGCVEKLEGCEYTGTCPPSTGGTAGQAGAPDSGGSGGTATTTGGATATGGAGGTTTSGHGGTSGGGTGGSGGGTGGTSTVTNTEGTSGGSGGAGGAGGMPCDGACEGETPVCDEDNDTCVECSEDEGCDEGVCDPEVHQCVECLGAADCEAPTALCDEEQQFCVECLTSDDCSETSEARCDAGSCTPCQANADCGHLTGTTVCDVPTGECVQCTAADEAVCDGTSCNPGTNTCTTTELGTVDDCQPCVADSECIGNAETDPLRRCVPMEFNGEPREKAYCLVRRSQVSQCAKPFVVVTSAVSLSGAPEESYCGIAQDSVTCEGVRDFLDSRTCPGEQDTECGCPRDEDGNCTAPGQGGFCRDLPAFDNQCTYQCGNVNQCPDTFACANQDPDFCE